MGVCLFSLSYVGGGKGAISMSAEKNFRSESIAFLFVF